MKLFKTMIVIYSPYPGDEVELEALAREAQRGDAICTHYRSERARELPPEAESFFEVA